MWRCRWFVSPFELCLSFLELGGAQAHAQGLGQGCACVCVCVCVCVPLLVVDVSSWVVSIYVGHLWGLGRMSKDVSECVCVCVCAYAVTCGGCFVSSGVCFWGGSLGLGCMSKGLGKMKGKLRCFVNI